jgi:hypothetical protein
LINIDGAYIAEDDHNKKQFCLKIEHPQRRTYWICAKDKEAIREWKTVLVKAAGTEDPLNALASKTVIATKRMSYFTKATLYDI